MLKAVIFDMDGVLIDSEPDHYRIENELLKKLGVKIDSAEHEKFCGTTTYYMWKTVKEKYNLKESIKELVKADRTSYMRYLNDFPERIHAIDGVKELIQNLYENNIAIALASSSPLDAVKSIINSLNIGKYFKVLVNGDEVKKSKPAPDIFLAAADKVGVKPCECLVVEDSGNGIKAAKKADMKCIGYKNIHSGRQNISDADIIIDSFSNISFDDILKLFPESNLD